MTDWILGAAYGAVAGLTVGLAGYRKAHQGDGQPFDAGKFGLTLVVCAAAGVAYVVGVGEPDIVTTGTFSGFVEVLLNRFGLTAEKLGIAK